MLRVLGAFSSGRVEICNSAALVFENQQNPNHQRRARVATLLASFAKPAPATASIFERAEDVRKLGFRDIDALHIAFAERQEADYFVTADDEILKRRNQASLDVKIIDPIRFVSEVKL